MYVHVPFFPRRLLYIFFFIRYFMYVKGVKVMEGSNEILLRGFSQVGRKRKKLDSG